MVGERVDAGPQRGRGRRHVVGEVALGGDQVGGCTGVGDHQERLGGPRPDVVQELAGDVVGPAVHQVVRRHHGADDARLDRPAERRQLVLVQHPRRHLRAGHGPVGLVRVGDQVLERGHGAPVRRMVAAQAARVAVARCAVRWGSSEKPSSLRPQRGCRRGFTTGAQTFSETDGSAACLARTSVPTTEPTCSSRSASQVAARPTGCGNVVAVPSQATPCSASVPVRNGPSPRRGTGAACWCRSASFSPQRELVEQLLGAHAQGPRGVGEVGHGILVVEWGGTLANSAG